MTTPQLEKYMLSEVENLHKKVDLLRSELAKLEKTHSHSSQSHHVVGVFLDDLRYKLKSVDNLYELIGEEKTYREFLERRIESLELTMRRVVSYIDTQAAAG